MKFLSILIALIAASPAFAQGDAARGAELYNQCKACHRLADGDTIILNGGRMGPNLFGIMDSAAGSAEFRYSNALIALAAAGIAWDDENFIAFVTDPGGFLNATLGDSAPRSRMSYGLEAGAADVAAYLRSLSTQ